LETVPFGTAVPGLEHSIQERVFPATEKFKIIHFSWISSWRTVFQAEVWEPQLPYSISPGQATRAGTQGFGTGGGEGRRGKLATISLMSICV